MNEITLQGDYIWIEPISGREFDVAIGARVISAEGRRIQVKDDDNKVIVTYFPHSPNFSTRLEKLLLVSLACRQIISTMSMLRKCLNSSRQ